jgi:uncharacterized repeat protein (TIGR02543 family)
MSQDRVGLSRYVVLGLLAASAIGSSSARGATYAVTELPRLTSGDPNLAAVPLSINNLGWVTGMAAVPKTYIILTINVPHAYLYKNGTVSDLGVLSGSGTFGMAAGRCINDANYVVGVNLGTPPDFGGDTTHNHGFLWQAGGSLIDLGSTTANPSDLSGAYAINAGGHIVGNWSPSSDPNIPHAFLRWSNGVVTNLGALGGSESFAWDINDSNQVVGKAKDSSGKVHAFLWSPAGGMTDLGFLPGYDASSEALAINNSGQVVGISTSGEGTGHSFLWKNGTMTDLGTLSGYPSTSAMAINDKGIVVGTAFDAGGQPTAFIWVGGQIYDLNTLVGTSGWTLQSATSINSVGQIVGSGIHSGLPAGYVIRVYALNTNVNPSGTGTIGLSPTGPFYNASATVTVTANPAGGCTFNNWSGDLSGSTSPTTISMTASRSITANFTQSRCTLTLASSPSGAGMITAIPLPDPNDGKYAYGAVVTLTANASSGYTFGTWSGDASGSANPTTVTMNGNKSVTASFNALPHYALTLMVIPTGAGTITADPLPGGDGKYAQGTVVTLAAEPNVGHTFSQWSGSISGSDNPTTITMDADKGATAEFATARHTLTLASNPMSGGTINASPPPGGDGKYAYGTVVTLTANQSAGYTFGDWSGDALGSSPVTTVTMNGNKNVTANFTQLRYTLTLASNPPDGGTIDANPGPDGDGKYVYGTVVTLTPNANAGYTFGYWSGGASGSAIPTTVTMTVDTSVTANFSQARETLTLAVQPPASGSILASPTPDGDGKYAYGTVVTLTASPAGGYLFASWSGDASGPNSPAQVTMDGNKSVTASFAHGYALTLFVYHDNWGTVSVEPNLPVYPQGTTVTLTAVPNSGKSFRGWTIDDTNYPTDDPRYSNPVDPNTLPDPLVLPLTMNSNMQVESDFKCGSGLSQALPLLTLMMGACVVVLRASRRER